VEVMSLGFKKLIRLVCSHGPGITGMHTDQTIYVTHTHTKEISIFLCLFVMNNFVYMFRNIMA
jgi:hypothetical protein